MSFVGIFGEAYEGQKPYCFISYAHSDAERIRGLLSALTRKGCRIWYDEGISPGDEWPEARAGHLAGAAVCVSFLSDRSLNSRYVYRELRFAAGFDKQIVCVLLDDLALDRIAGFIGRKPDWLIYGFSGIAGKATEKKLTGALPDAVFDRGKRPVKKQILLSAALVTGIGATTSACFFLIPREDGKNHTSVDSVVSAVSAVSEAEVISAEEIAELAGMSEEETAAESVAESTAESVAESTVESVAETAAESTVESDETDTESQRKISGYTDFLQTLYNTVSTYRETGVLKYDLHFERAHSFLFAEKGDVRFLLEDLDGDGCEELLTGIMRNGEFHLMGICSLNREGEAEWQLFEGQLMDGGRLLTSARFGSYNMSPDDDVIIQYIYTLLDEQLILEDSCCKWDTRYYRGIRLTSIAMIYGDTDFEANRITEEEYNALVKNFTASGEVCVYPLTQSNVEHIRDEEAQKLEGGESCRQEEWFLVN